MGLERPGLPSAQVLSAALGLVFSCVFPAQVYATNSVFLSAIRGLDCLTPPLKLDRDSTSYLDQLSLMFRHCDRLKSIAVNYLFNPRSGR